MKTDKVMYIEDSASKYMDICKYLKTKGIKTVDWVTNAEDAIKQIEAAASEEAPYDLLVSDMHFDYFGKDDIEAGEKTLKLIREKGYTVPVIFCSSQDWVIPGSIGNIFYNPNRDWELEADELFREIKSM